MDLDRHDFELDELMERIRANDNRLIALQVPEGLKMQALEMMDTIETETSAQVVLAADPCYGACDLVHDKMQLMGVELVAHMGHSQMNIDSGMPTQFINVTYDGDPELQPVMPWLEQHRAMAQQRLSQQAEASELTEEEAQERFMDAVGRLAPLRIPNSGWWVPSNTSISFRTSTTDWSKQASMSPFPSEVPVCPSPVKSSGAIIRVTTPPSAITSSWAAVISTPSVWYSIPANRWPCSTLTPARLKKCHSSVSNASCANDLASS